MSKSKHNDGLDDLFAGLPETVSTPPLKAPAAVDDPLADLDELESLAERPKPAALSRPETPRSAPKRSLSRSRTPGNGYGMPMSARNSLEQKRAEKSVTPPESPAKKEAAPSSGGGWGWGSLWNTATTAVKAAEGLVQEIQQSEEGKKWVTQVKGNVDGLRGLAGEIKSTAIPTFSSLLNHLAPPIASHEQLRIHITHDLQNYPFVEAVVFGVFDRVMQQVEGGDLLIVQRGGSSKPRSAEGTFGGGPWWKATEKRELNACSGLQEGLKLAKAAAESYASEHSKAAAEEAATATNSQNPTRKSNIFLSIQPTIHTMDALVGSVTGESTGDEEKVVSFAIHLLDPEHEISFSTLSQSLPLQWLDWLNAPPPADAQQGQWALPEVIQDIMQIGGTDPREWVVEWVEETVGLSVGVIAQKYVAKRMRIGDAADAGEEVRQATREQENADAKAE